ncbi:hypothetical protein B5K08_22385 [Rhizobium leguminosarum bv. trifolii]|uniref:Uncharacterized protein n=1 Tax=Rhizobium leguminosarum bv. trifolii TaxID=386 RepID=A0A3E1B7R1_RHILT|nr:hypothetical protein [Rhizobium leguminosarum]RFB87199.1 hypothetical protein B5K08_22385 [Rhizobium leguminosarum bv. trifolii]RFB87380.1 hypothetical protein B5K10_22375 [Rhizobium leguminosarum bv. trifolii]
MMASALTSDDEAAVRGNATWKFDFLDSVNADPKAGGACLAVIKAYLHFASKARPQAFCSLPELMLRTGGSRPRVLRAKVTLEKLGYLVPMYVTDEGATMYRLVNARKQLIDDHLRIAREKLAAEKRDRKRRQRTGGVGGGGNETILPDFDYFERNDTPVCNETIPNTLDEYPGGIFSEGRDILTPNSKFTGRARQKQPRVQSGLSETAGYAEVSRADDSEKPIPVPSDQDEAQEMMEAICEGRDVPDVVRRRLLSMLQAGVLTPRMASNILGPVEDAA